MQFIDEAQLSVRAGRGGDGCLSFRREKYIPRGGPDGGNGGHGGSVFIEANPALHTLADFEYQRHYRAEDGDHGRGKNQHGRRGDDCIIHVPCGTVIYDRRSETPLADLVEPGDRLLVARGGRGGRGNAHFANAVRKAPRFAERGGVGVEVELRCELKLIADVGLVGMPNAGKSSLLAAMSNAQPKIASYPFTTLSPNLGIVSVDDDRIVLADIPGLIEGAHDNRGLGLAFLRHVERTRLLLYVIDVSSGDPEEWRSQWDMLRREFAAYDSSLLERPHMVLGNKIDLISDRSLLEESFFEIFRTAGTQAFLVSALSGEGVDALLHAVIAFVRHHPRPRGQTRFFASADSLNEGLPYSLEVVRLPGRDGFRLLHPHLERAVRRFDFDQDEAVHRFNNLLRKYRAEQALAASGAKEGDTVWIGDTGFNFEPERAKSDARPYDSSKKDDREPGDDGEERLSV